MTYEHTFRLPLPNGLHARPASCLAEAARGYQASVIFVNDRNGREANARSVLALMGTDSHRHDPCRLVIAGLDGDLAKADLVAFIENRFARTDEADSGERGERTQALIPRSLREAGLSQFHAGEVACRGIGWGRIMRASSFQRPVESATEVRTDVGRELAQFTDALARVREDYVHAANRSGGPAASILKAHLSLIDDPALVDRITECIRDGCGAGEAVGRTIREHAALLGKAESSYLRERVLDLEDIGTQLVERILGPGFSVPSPVLEAPCILMAERLTPRQFLALDRSKLQGLVLGQAGQTSHTVILARSFNIPTLTGISSLSAICPSGTEAILDAGLGILVTDIPEGVRRYYERDSAKLARIQERLDDARGRAAATADGRRLEVAANIAIGDEAAAAFAQGAEGIGLFRTELLFMDRSTAPDEEEQYEIYVSVLRAAAGRPVIIRTLDIGGDKAVSFLRLPPENNPFLGYRGVRLYAEHASLVATQMRALWRAARHGPLQVLVPMVACVEEARLARRIFNEAQSALQAAGVEHGHEVRFGLMLEVPAVAFILSELCELADFFSIGTNDLIQYSLAVDRENDKVASLYSPLHPGFLRLLRHLVDGARSRGRWIGLCGEMAEDPALLPVLVGLGLNEISLAAPRIPTAKATLARLDAADCLARLQRVLACQTQEEVRRELELGRHQDVPILSTELVLDRLALDSKADVIHAMVDALHLAGRTDQPAEVEEAVWRREDSYSTGFGHGFALPHCKCDEVHASSIVIARLDRPVYWPSLDGAPVDLVILLVMRSGDYERGHTRSLALLSRMLMQETFRVELRSSPTAGSLTNLIKQTLAATGDRAAALSPAP